ncbi:MAG TPA: PhoU domain-containing protein [Acidimicrobiia bacterium]|nr:PhoU domain-containing protein [Acidimicrobiia bacterium]
MTQTHEAVQARIGDVGIEVVRLGALASGAIVAATAALTAGDLVEADRVIADDDAVDAQRHAIEDECLRLLGTGLFDQELRFVATTLRVAHELERTADLMVNVARTAWRLFPHQVEPPVSGLLDRIGRQATVQIRVAVNAFVDRDAASAAALADMDDALDAMHDALLRHALAPAHPLARRPDDRVAHAPADDTSVVQAVQLALVARHYERAGDHAVTIAGWVPFVVTGTRR